MGTRRLTDAQEAHIVTLYECGESSTAIAKSAPLYGLPAFLYPALVVAVLRRRKVERRPYRLENRTNRVLVSERMGVIRRLRRSGGTWEDVGRLLHLSPAYVRRWFHEASRGGL